jgi:hypothetical protein
LRSPKVDSKTNLKDRFQSTHFALQSIGHEDIRKEIARFVNTFDT